MTKAEELAEKRHQEVLSAHTKTLDGVESTREELGELSRRFDLHEQNDHHVHTLQDGRLSKLENSAEASGAHNIEALQRALAERKQAANVWKGRAWAIFAALTLAGITGLVTNYLSTR